jgi:membrane protein required for colicin V production
MQGADYVIVVVLLISLVVGLVRGFVREAVMLIAWLVGIWAAWHFSYLMHPYLGGLLAQPGVQEWAGRAIVLLLVLLLGALLASLVSFLTHRAVGLGVTDRLLGGLFGLVRAAVVIGLAVTAGHAVKLDGENWWTRSRLMPYAELVAHWLERYAEPAVQQMLDEAGSKAGS